MSHSRVAATNPGFALLTQLFDHSIDGMLAFDGELHCAYGNRAVARLTGVDPATRIGRDAREAFTFVSEGDLQAALAGKRTTAFGQSFTNPLSGATYYFDGHYFPLLGSNGRVAAVGLVIRDTTLHRQVEEDLRETESRFRNMADASPVLLWMARPDGMCTFFNQSWLDFTGRTLEEEWGVGWAESLHFEDFEACMNTYVAAFNIRRRFEMEYRLRRADGQYRWILDRGNPRYTPEGTFAGYIGSCIDITERRRLEQELRAGVEVRDEFLSVASHELGTPLTSLQLLVETLLRNFRRPSGQELPADAVENQMGAIAEQLRRLGSLVETLLDVSRLAEGRLALTPETLDLSDLVRRVVARMSHVAVDAGCAVSLDIGGPVHGVWDRMRTEQVVSNLLSNAFKYGAGKPIEVAVGSDDGLARLRVVDRGIGIPLDKQDVIFERFERAAPKNQYGGLGLGLWIARRAVEEMGGAIRVESREGMGARFEVDLPRRSPQRS